MEVRGTLLKQILKFLSNFSVISQNFHHRVFFSVVNTNFSIISFLFTQEESLSSYCHVIFLALGLVD